MGSLPATMASTSLLVVALCLAASSGRMIWPVGEALPPHLSRNLQQRLSFGQIATGLGGLAAGAYLANKYNNHQQQRAYNQQQAYNQGYNHGYNRPGYNSRPVYNNHQGYGRPQKYCPWGPCF